MHSILNRIGLGRAAGQGPDKGPGRTGLDASARAVLKDWAGMTATAHPLFSRKPAAGMLCLAVGLGLQRGMVSVAAGHSLGARLAVAATGDPGAGSFSGEALGELCQRLREALLSAEAGSLLQLRPQLLDDQDWPGQEPDEALMLRVEGQALELRLWRD